MHTLKLNISDEAYNHVIFLLKSLNKHGVDIIETKKIENTKESIKLLLQKSDNKPFSTIDDPVKWQQEQRNEW